MREEEPCKCCIRAAPGLMSTRTRWWPACAASRRRATTKPAALRPPRAACWRWPNGSASTAVRMSQWRRPAFTGGRYGMCWKAASSWCWPMPSTSRTFPAARPTSTTRSGCASCWSAGLWPRASCRPSRSASCVSSPAIATDQGAPAGGQPAAQGARAVGDQARLRRDRHPRQVGPGHARRALLGHDGPGDAC